ncbi:hypothetical protein CH35J_011772 [Colletotrichum higginsianum]|uniref:Uncharacterized protein n=1 Tax=Colletotrichum higginsianum TaxID=80884 RepID=A0A4V4NA37_9PEZI|nr:hypothetical protein CH35J_011772 [Colletotrichum higginsianum]
MALDSELSLGSKDPMHEVISEEDTSVVTNTHYLRLAHKLFDFYNLPGNLTQGRATWEATLMPVGRTYFDPEKQAHVQVTIRPDIVYGVKLPGTDLDFGQANYCFSFRTQFAAMGDLDFLIFFQFYRMVILPDDTPLDVWRRGHGGVFHFTVLDQHQNALKPACYHGFLCKAVDTTPRDH